MEATSRKLPAAPSKIGRHGEYESPKKAVAPIRSGSDPAAQKVIRATPKTNAAGRGSLESRPVASTREPNSTSVGAGGGTPSCTPCRSGEVKGATRTQQASDLVSRACGCRAAVNRAMSSAVATTPAGMQRFSPEMDRRTLARAPARAKTSPCARSARRNAPVQVDPLALCLAQQSAGEWPPVDVLPIATLNSALPTPEILDGYEGPPLKSISFGFTQRIGAAAIIVPKTVNPKSFERVLFWMQGEALPMTYSAFLASLSAVAQMSGAMILVIRTGSSVPVRERSRIHAAFVDAAMKGGVTVYRNGTEERIEIERDATYLLGGWSRGAMAAITVASRTVSGSKISTLRGRLKGLIAVGPGGLNPNNADDAQLISSVLSENATKNLRGLDALFVISYADGDTYVQGARCISTFGSGPGRVVLLTATCQNHKRLLAMSGDSGDTGCVPGQTPPAGGFYASVDSPAVPACADVNLGPFWTAAVPSMLDYGGPNKRTAFDRLFRQELAVHPVARVQVLARGSVSGSIVKETIAPIDRLAGEILPRREVKCDGAGLDLDSLVTQLSKGTPLSAKGCPLLIKGGVIAGLGIGAIGTVFCAPPGKTISFAISKALPSWTLGAEGFVRISMAFMDLDYFSEAEAGLMFRDQGPRMSRLPVCYKVRPGAAAPATASGRFVIKSAPVYDQVICGVDNPAKSCKPGTRVVSQRGGRGWLVLQSHTMRLPSRDVAGIPNFEFSFRASGTILVAVGLLEGIVSHE